MVSQQARAFPHRPSASILLAGLLALLCLALPGLAQPPRDDAPLQAYVDRNEISEDGVVTLTVRVDSSFSNARPAVSGLDRDFIQLGISTSSSYSNTNGNVQSWTEYRVSLAPRSTGELTIPSFRLENQRTDPITIHVAEAPGEDDQQGTDEIFLETELDKDEVYVQEQLVYTVKLHYSIKFDQGAQLSAPEVDDAVVQQLGNDRTYQEINDGVRYNVTERTFVIFPQSSGEVTISPVRFSATVGGRLNFGRNLNRGRSSREIRLASDAYTVNVKPQPADFPGDTWLPAGDVSVSEQWSGDPGDLRVGESLTRDIELRVRGLSSSLLPAIEYGSVPGLKFYPDQPDTEDSADDGGVSGTRSASIAVVPSEAGEYELPEIRLPWWNTDTDSLEYAVIPATTLRVTPAPGTASSGPAASSETRPDATSPPDPAPRDPDMSWLWISLAATFALGWALTALLWLNHRRAQALAAALPAARSGAVTAAAPSGAGTALRRLKQACDDNDLHAMRQAVIGWGQAFFGNRGIRTLDDLKAYCHSPTLAALLFNLEQALYGDGGEQDVRGRQLYREVREIHRQGPPERNRERHRYSLPPLYRN